MHYPQKLPFRTTDNISDNLLAAAKQVKLLAEKYKLKMPISMGIYQILNRETEPLEFLESYLGGLG